MLELRGVTKRFGSKVAVKDFSLQGRESEFIVIFGPAGAGKSTTLNLIAGILAPTEGEIFVNGVPLKGVPPERRNMSMVFENYALYSHLSVFENMAFPLRARRLGDAEIKQRVHDMAEVLQITDFLTRRPGFLSGGQRQRVALGRALIRDADVYLLDEPISHLDAKLRHRMRVELKAMCAKKAATVVHVTHDYREAMSLSHRMVVIYKGQIMQFGTPDEIYHTPANEFVASFVGEPPMSFLDVHRDAGAGSRQLIVTSAEPQAVKIPLSETSAASLDKRPSTGSLRIGVRASDISLNGAPSETHTTPAEIYVVETLGHRDIVTVKVGKDLVKVIAPSGIGLTLKDTVWLNIDPRTYHLFHDEQAVAHPVDEIRSPQGV